jgi:hypothetical protein
MKTKFKISNVMKWCFKNTWFFFLGIIFLVSCSSNNDVPDPLIGKWDDNIVLSQKSATLSSNTNSITITTKYSGWWLAGIGLDNKAIDLTGINRLSENFIVTNSEFQVERKNGKAIIITMNPNTTGSERILNVALQGGDYFDVIHIVQSK